MKQKQKIPIPRSPFGTLTATFSENKYVVLVPSVYSRSAFSLWGFIKYVVRKTNATVYSPKNPIIIPVTDPAFFSPKWLKRQYIIGSKQSPVAIPIIME